VPGEDTAGKPAVPPGGSRGGRGRRNERIDEGRTADGRQSGSGVAATAVPLMCEAVKRTRCSHAFAGIDFDILCVRPLRAPAASAVNHSS